MIVITHELDALDREIRIYLGLIADLRAGGIEPRWLPDPAHQFAYNGRREHSLVVLAAAKGV